MCQTHALQLFGRAYEQYSFLFVILSNQYELTPSMLSGILSSDQKNLLKGYNMLLYFAGSMIMYEPTDECVTDFWTNGTLRQLPVKSSNPAFVKAASLLRDSCPGKDTCMKILTDDYHRLFGDTIPLAPPRASYYLKHEINSTDTIKNISAFYNSYGWHLKPHNEKPDDHLGTELLFLTKLVDKYIQLDDEPCLNEMKKEILRFISEFLLPWLPMWEEDIQQHASSQCYKGIGKLIHASIEDLYGFFKRQRKLPYMPRN